MINISLNDQSFRYDVHSIVKAFYPEEELNFDITNAEEAFGELSVSFEEELTVRIPKGHTKRAERILQKNELKRQLYDVLSERSKRSLPWGTLTGIRPVKIPAKILSEGGSVEEVLSYMKKTYYTSEEKARLAALIAQKQLSLMEGIDMDNTASLYVGVPFCPSICAYCSFSSYPIGLYKDRADAYTAALKREIDAVSEGLCGKKIISVYFGGGTPTTLSAEALRDLCTYIKNRFNLSECREFTVECGRPDSITEEKLYALKAAGVGRICINPQTMNNKTLQLIGRRHTEEDILKAFETAALAGFTCINADLIAGLPGEGIEEVKYTLNKIRKLNPASVTVHSLAVKRASRINRDWDENIAYGDVDPVMGLFEETANSLEMEPYYLYRQKQIAGNLENIGYARRGAESIYNILIMGEFHDIVALGAGAISKFLDGEKKPVRIANIKDVDLYINKVDEMIEKKAGFLS